MFVGFNIVLSDIFVGVVLVVGYLWCFLVSEIDDAPCKNGRDFNPKKTASQQHELHVRCHLSTTKRR